MIETASHDAQVLTDVYPERNTPITDPAEQDIKERVDDAFPEKDRANESDHEIPALVDVQPSMLEATTQDPDGVAEAVTGQKISLLRRIGNWALVRAKVEGIGLLFDFGGIAATIAGVPGMTLETREGAAAILDGALIGKFSKDHAKRHEQTGRLQKLGHKAGHIAALATVTYAGAKGLPIVVDHVDPHLVHGTGEYAAQLFGKVGMSTAGSSVLKRVFKRH